MQKASLHFFGSVLLLDQEKNKIHLEINSEESKIKITSLDNGNNKTSEIKIEEDVIRWEECLINLYKTDINDTLYHGVGYINLTINNMDKKYPIVIEQVIFPGESSTKDLYASEDRKSFFQEKLSSALANDQIQSPKMDIDVQDRIVGINDEKYRKNKKQKVTNTSYDVTKRNKPLPLRNAGNTCFLNSTLQCLMAIDHFQKFFEQSNGEFASLFHYLPNNLGKIAEIVAKHPKNNYGIGNMNDPEISYLAIVDQLLSESTNGLHKNLVFWETDLNLLCKTCYSYSRESTKESQVITVNNTMQSIDFSIFRDYPTFDIRQNCNNCTKKETFQCSRTVCSSPKIAAVKVLYSVDSDKCDITTIAEKGSICNQNYVLSGFVSFCGNLGSGHAIAHVKKGNNWYRCSDASIKKVDSPRFTNVLMVFYKRE